MSKSGRYAYDPVVKRVVKISDTPYLETPVYFPNEGVKRWDPYANRSFQWKSEQRAWMKAKGLREVHRDEFGSNPLRGLAESRARGSKVFIT